MNIGYKLKVIGDEDVPMAAFLETNSTEIILSLVLFATLTLLLYIYIKKCHTYRMRACMLQSMSLKENEKIKLSWNLWKLQSRIQELEAEAVSHIVL